MTASAPAARDVARRVLTRVVRERAYATLALDAELSRSGLDARDRRLVTELVYGTLRHRPRLERALSAHTDLDRAPPAVRLILLVAAYQLLLTRIPPHAAVDDAVTAVRAGHGARLAGFANAVLRKLSAAGEPALPDDPRERLAVEHSLAPWILDELAAQLPPDELAAAAAALAAPAPLWIRVNPTRTDPTSLIATLTGEGATVETTPLAFAALAARDLGDPSASPSFAAGLWTVQDLGAQLVGLLARPRPGASILDACAGVGGKTTHLAELAAASPTSITALDRSARKLDLLTSSAARLGLSGIRTVTGALADAPAEPLHDLVIVDAPCSGLGVLRRHPELRGRVTPSDVADLARVQAALLDAAAARVAPGGVLLYAVCTFTRAEGPDQLAAFLARTPTFTLDPADTGPSPLDPSLVDHGTLRTWPHRHGADAFFAARLIRTG